MPGLWGGNRFKFDGFIFSGQSFDRNQDGVLQRLEFEEFMSQLGVFLARQELRVVFDNFDANKDGNIAYSEFINVLRVSSTTLLRCVTAP
jgi:Ca2+-binding EF-hand superfamily protein